MAHLFTTRWGLAVITLCLWIISQENVQSEIPWTPQSGEARLVSDLLSTHHPDAANVRPVLNSSQTLLVKFGVELVQILNLDEKNQIIEILVWESQRWRDEFLTWDPGNYSGVTSIHLSTSRIWTPDIVLYSSIEMKRVDRVAERLQLHYDGSVVRIPPIVYRSSCKIDMTNFPYDEQHCDFKFGTWSHSADQMDMEIAEDPPGFAMDVYMESDEWKVIGNTAIRNRVKYKCCNHTYTDVTFSLTLRRNSGFHTKLLLLPTLLLTFLLLVVFWIPAQRPDRTGLGMSLFSCFMLLLLVVVETSPPSTSAKLVTYICISMVLTTFATFISTVSVNICGNKKQVPSIFNQMCTRLCLRFFCLPMMPPLQPGYRSKTTEQNSESEVQLSNKGLRNNSPQQWMILSLLLDRISFIIYLFIVIVFFISTFPLPIRS